MKPLSAYNILVVDDEPLIRKSLYEILKIDGYHAHMAASGEEAVQTLKTVTPDIVITDMKLPKMNGLELLSHIKKTCPGTEVILITGYGTIETAVEAMKKRAFDYVTKPIIDSEIKLVIRKIIDKKNLMEENEDLRKMAEKNKRLSFCGIIGSSPAMQKIYNMIDSVASTKATIMITGESGTGKSLVARAIHQSDKNRCNNPFIEVSCGALSETLLESELFGHVKGAFTGAIRDKKGRFDMAQGGTIFLDEIDTFTPNLQVKLLRILQEGEYEPVGESTTRKTDARVIVATNQNLTDLVASGDFREDLYYRINVIPVAVPALRERKEDIEPLVRYFIEKCNKKNNKQLKGISDEVRKLFMDYHWPGNIRQLENVLEGSVIMAKTDIINKGDLPHGLQSTPGMARASKTEPGSESEAGDNGKTLKEGLKEPAKELILAALKKYNWNRTKAAESLGVNRTTLYNKMKKYGIAFKG
jgi:DNA-binding NtrC family response regulator